MAGSPANLQARAAIEAGTLAGPRLYAASPPLNLNNVTTPEAARAAVSAARAAGYDLNKSHHLTDVPVWQAVQEEARAKGLPVAGHVTNEVSLARAMAAGQQVEHLDGMAMALLPENAPERQLQFAQILPPPVLAQWAQQAGGLAQAGFTPENGADFIRLRRRIVAALHRAGVPLMAGSDTAQAFHLWGPGLIAEVEALHAAGLSNMAALRSATVVPRDYFRSLPNGGSALGWRAEFGTVETGARADLILLRGDPSRDLAALRRLDTVIAAGRVHDRAALDHMLDEASRAAKAQH
jgi:imidazolonepropionase-like amidohydrolase